jgi:hypothetical protein
VKKLGGPPVTKMTEQVARIRTARRICVVREFQFSARVDTLFVLFVILTNDQNIRNVVHFILVYVPISSTIGDNECLQDCQLIPTQNFWKAELKTEFWIYGRFNNCQRHLAPRVHWLVNCLKNSIERFLLFYFPNSHKKGDFREVGVQIWHSNSSSFYFILFYLFF